MFSLTMTTKMKDNHKVKSKEEKKSVRKKKTTLFLIDKKKTIDLKIYPRHQTFLTKRNEDICFVR